MCAVPIYYLLNINTPPKYIHDHYKWTRVCWRGPQQFMLRLAGLIEEKGNMFCLTSNLIEQELALLKLSGIEYELIHRGVIPYDIVCFLDGTE